MSFTFNTGIPASNNNPSSDQPIMLTNNVSTDAILAVDHVSFNSTGSGGAGASGGQHLRVTYNSKTTPAPAAPVDPISIAYTADATSAAAVPTAISSASAVAQNFLINQNGTYPLTSIKAFGIFTVTPALVTFAPDMAFNVVNITKPGPSAQIYVINLVSGVVVGTTVVPFITSTSNANIFTWSYAANTLTINAGTSSAGTKITFAILQI